MKREVKFIVEEKNIIEKKTREEEEERKKIYFFFIYMNQKEYTIKVKQAIACFFNTKKKKNSALSILFVALLQIKGTLLKVTLVDHVLDLSQLNKIECPCSINTSSIE